jgi:hypothetical protein
MSIHFTSWESLLDWCLEVYPARVGFVVEPEGFVIAHAGDWSLGHLEGVGPQLITVAEQVREIEDAGAMRFFALRFESYWLTGVAARRDGMGVFVVAFLGAQPMDPDVQVSIQAQVEHNLGHL